MPPASKHLDVNVHVSVSKQFIKHKEVKQLLSLHFDWNTLSLSFKWVTTPHSTVNSNVKNDVILNLVPGSTLTLLQNFLKYIKANSNDTLGNIEHATANTTKSIVTEDLLEDAIQEEEQEEDESDLTAADTWITKEVYIDSHTSGPAHGFTSVKLG
ncbi:hypothetical protein K493DRAFT_300974 [Basidiobolus meristosporus CBS 931.73]|uniref:Uncharacterized protein n=1 Tax=Basidiobolus meristosporus CBS 931.73 TaxID=1314790 RepID=A0A1Y1YFE8_9FUNG|nr:hypothetical protein K493DRAFT_300974 [Basidiobolus meristosporus CBS 931.73]|eukprot:ORX96324.1 hypothetical protein K493DRAFT_300974 [Basidiobolus meristosporus CBS 931.73]